MKEFMSPKERVEAVLLKKKADYVPFTVYESMIPQCEIERKLRNEGLCIVKRLNVHKMESPDVKEVVTHYEENGLNKIRTDIQTPVGNLFFIQIRQSIDTAVGYTHWEEQKIFKSKEDYKAIEFMIRNRVYMPNYESFLKEQKYAGDDIILRADVGGYEPLQEIMISIMGIENFSIEWAENRDEVLKLYKHLVDDRRKIYPIIAKSPALHANYGGNVAAEIVGLERFEKYFLPHYQEFSEVMHKNGKLAGSHFDGNNKLIASLMAKSGLDYIEAFTPSPDTDMTVKEALDIWPDKILWINFPSSIHVRSKEEIKKTTLEILEQAKPLDRLIVGITEDVPKDKWQDSFLTIMEVLKNHGRISIR
ncbi:MAG: hypothetical protein ABH873_00085 [Candidatus Firestonebacteria bacterium]